MTYPDKLSYVSDLTVHSFGAVTTITGIVPVEEAVQTLASAASFDYLPASAGHIYFIENIAIIEATAIVTGLPTINGYDIGAVSSVLCSPGLGSNADLWRAKAFWVTRLAHVVGVNGTYSIVYNGFDITYT